MPHRSLAVLVLSLTLAAPLAAYQRGDVLLENRTLIPPDRTAHELWVHVGFEYAFVTGGFPLIHKLVPYGGEGRLLVPAPNQFVFHHQRTVSTWDGVPRTEGKGYEELFTADAELGEIAPKRSGNFLVAERFSDPARGARLIEFNTHGRVTEYSFPTFLNVQTNRALGATHIELLADQCTLLYTVGVDHPAGNRVLRMSLCTGQPLPDFAALMPGEYAGAIRQLPNGDVLVANGSLIRHFTPEGEPLRSYYHAGVTHLALSPDAKSFWAAGVSGGRADLREFDLSTTIAGNRVPLGNNEMRSLHVPLETTDLVVVGEWRASAARTKRVRAARK